MQDPMQSSPPPPPPAPPSGQGASGRAITSLVLGILGLPICCPLVAPIAWFLGAAELKDIAGGAAPAAGEGVAKAGKILGIVGTALMLVWILWIFLWGGMAILRGLAELGG